MLGGSSDTNNIIATEKRRWGGDVYDLEALGGERKHGRFIYGICIGVFWARMFGDSIVAYWMGRVYFRQISSHRVRGRLLRVGSHGGLRDVDSQPLYYEKHVDDKTLFLH